MRWIFFLVAILPQYLSRVYSQDMIYPYMENGKIGFKDSRDSIVMLPVYDFYEPFQEGHKWTVIGKGFYERLNNSATERQVKFTGKFGFISLYGGEIFSPQFDMVFAVFEDHALLGKGEGHLRYDNWPEDKNISFSGNMGVVHRAGYVSVPFDFNEIVVVRSSNNHYWYTLDDRGRSYLYLDSTQLHIPLNVNGISDFQEGRAKIQVEGKYGFIDTLGQVVVQPIYDRARDYFEEKAFVKFDDRYFWIDGAGAEIEGERTIIFDEVDKFSEGYARVRVFDDYGFIRPDSSFFIFPRFKEASPFFNLVASVQTTDSFGYVHTDGRKDIVSKYQENRINITPDPGILSKLPEYNAPIIQLSDSDYFFKPIDTLTIKNMVTFQAEAMRWAPWLYFNYPQMLARVSAGEGTMAGRFLFNVPFLRQGNEIWEGFKREVLLKLLAEDKMRALIWKIIMPYYKSSFQSMPELHQQVYLDMINYLEEYYDNYDLKKTRNFLENNESFFAYEHADGSTSPFRKASAQVDRLILIYEVISVEDVQKWIRKVKTEVSKW